MKKASCFISYSHDSENHNKWVKKLYSKLKHAGLIVYLDQIDKNYNSDIINYMINCVQNSDKILLICTPKYKNKIKGGVAFEKKLMSSELYNDSNTNKFLPIIKEGDENSSIPIQFLGNYYINMLGNRITNKSIQELVTLIVQNKRNNNIAINNKHIIQSKRMKNVIPNESTGTRIQVCGYTLLGGRGTDGIRYLWKTSNELYTESLAFNKRIKAYDISEIDKKTSAYTTSCSFGCILKKMNCQCTFCATGTIAYEGPLTGEEIALQNIFMAEYDSDCPSWTEVRDNSREFAFMGQGEPGFSYPQIRRAIQITDIAMKELKQNVTRYLISTCGIPDMIDSFISDWKAGIFKNPVTLHFSLNAVGKKRTSLMPINQIYDYRKTLVKTNDIFNLTGEKVAIGILLFDHFIPKNNKSVISSISRIELNEILKELNPKIHKIDLCDVNINKAINSQRQVSNEVAHQLLNYVIEKGFQAKLFSSFGSDKNSGCGMLSSIKSKSQVQSVGKITMKHYENSLKLLKEILLSE